MLRQAQHERGVCGHSIHKITITNFFCSATHEGKMNPTPEVRTLLPHWLLPQTLQTRMLLLIMGLLLCLISATGVFVAGLISSILEEYMGRSALNVSKTVALIPHIQNELLGGEPGGVQPLAEAIRTATGARFVVVGDREGRRYSHPVPERIGKLMVGGDNRPALEEGKAYISKAVGTLGPSIRGKTAIFDQDQNIIGVVSVGYLLEAVDKVIAQYQQKILLMILTLLGVGVVGALLIARGVKRAILGLEPREIAQLYKERNAILESIREGVIAINSQGVITMMNQEASAILHLESDAHVNRNITEVLPQTRMLEVLQTGKSQFDQEMEIGGNEVIVNRVPIFEGERVTGVVSSFRPKHEIDQLVRKLSQIQEYSDVLRAQTHEYSNKLHTIAGLIQLGSHRDAIDLIAKETSGYQELLNLLTSAVPDPLISAIILGKYNRAQELKVEFSVDPESRMADLPSVLSREKVVTILGNLLENALEAALENDRPPQVKLSMTDLGNDLIFEVEDSGAGINPELERQIFKEGFTTRSRAGRGLGLHLMQKALTYLKGYLTLGSSELGGAAFTIIIPKNTEPHE